MNILVACETSGTVRDAFNLKGHNAVSCDLLPTDAPGPHWQGNVVHLLRRPSLAAEVALRPVDTWHALIAHPPCTYVCSSGLHWNGRVVGRADETDDALEFFKYLWNCDIKYICIENPVGLASKIKKPSQIIQPYYFGHDASKATCLWLRRLPLLCATKYILPRYENGLPRWANQTASGQNRLGLGEDRWKDRSKTYNGVAQAMSEQWLV